MNTQNPLHKTIAWTKQRLDELDAGISAAEQSFEEGREEIRQEARDALTHLRDLRGKIHADYENLRSNAADAGKKDLKELQETLEAEWVEVEAAFQSLLSSVGERSHTARNILITRVKAQRQAWDESLQKLNGQAAEAVEKAHIELDAAIKRLSDETEKLQTRIAEVKDAGGASWDAVKSGIDEAKQVHSRTMQKIREALSKLF